jgi:hypothetical protein
MVEEVIIVPMHDMKVYGDVEAYLHSLSRHGRFTYREKTPLSIWIWGWECPKASLHALENTKISCVYRESKQYFSVLSY